jgi:hypothetical protein
VACDGSADEAICMILPSLLVFPFLYVGIYVFAFLRRAGGRRTPSHELPAALISSGTAGAWAWLLAPALPSLGSELTFSSRGPATAEALFGMLVLFFLLSIGPNLVGLARLRMLLVSRARWLRLGQQGGFIPVGVIYGYAILVISIVPLLPLAVVRPSILLDILAASFFYVPAAASGIVAVGVLVALERSTPGG